MAEEELAETDERLDVTSASFDPKLALANASRVMLPRPRAKKVENLATARQLLPPEAEHSSAELKRMSRGKREDADERQMLAKQRVGKLEQAKNALYVRRAAIFQKIVRKASKCGPLAPVYQAFEQELSVVVTTSHSRGWRGVALAERVVAFDKHINLVLRNVREEYVVLTRVFRKGRWRRKQEHRLRHMPCVFLRGANIIAFRIAQPNDSMEFPSLPM